MGLGGTSSLWGGQLLPVRETDIRARPSIGAPGWPIAHSEIAPCVETLERWLGIDTGSFDLGSARAAPHGLTALHYADWAPRLSKWLGFGQRNLAAAWSADFRRYPGVEVWLNAEAFDWRYSGGADSRAVREIIARSSSGHTLRVQPAYLVIAAGALESARLVLEMNEAAGWSGRGVKELTGRYLHDHLSVRIAQVRLIDAARFQALFAPIFEGPTMRSLRLELAPRLLEAEALPSLYAHFVAENPVHSGFAVLRGCLRAAQRRDVRGALASALRIPGALPAILQLLHGRFVQKRLVFPRGSTLFLHIDVEQAPRYENRVYLGQSGAEGRRPLHIDWDLDADTARTARRVQMHFDRFWTLNGLDHVAALTYVDPGEQSDEWARNVHDIYHPAGTTRMAADPALGVVDANLKIHGSSNAFVVGSSVFPSMGAANPTLTAMALAIRLANFIDRASRRA
jgi:hypothetical protein